MNNGTIIRTVLAVATVINTGAIASGIAEFDNPTVNFWYKILSFAATAVILFVNTYYNNDYTEEALYGTGITRQKKAEKDPNYVGDRMFPDYDELEDEEAGDEDE